MPVPDGQTDRARWELPDLISCRGAGPVPLIITGVRGAVQDRADPLRSLGDSRLGPVRRRQVIALPDKAVWRVLLPQDASRIVMRVLVALAVAEPSRAR